MIENKEVKRYEEINKQIKILEDEKKVLNAKFKKELGSAKGSYEYGDLVVSVIPQDKSQLDKEKAILYIKDQANGMLEHLLKDGIDLEEAESRVEATFSGVIVAVEEIDHEALENLFLNGVLVAQDFHSKCVIPKTVLTLRVDPKGRPENEGGGMNG